jgi:hypothetical protein
MIKAAIRPRTNFVIFCCPAREAFHPTKAKGHPMMAFVILQKNFRIFCPETAPEIR